MDEDMDGLEETREAGRPVIRPMVADDLAEVLRIIRLHDSDDYKAAKDAYEGYDFGARDEGGYVVLVEPKEERVVGVCGHHIDDLEADGTHWLGWTYVNPFFQGRGYGTLLLNHVIAELRHLAARKLFLSTSSLEKYSEAVRFYERHGFVLEGRLRDYYQEGEDQLIMGLRLTRG